MSRKVMVVGAGLAGSEAAWQLSRRGFHVLLVEMRPEVLTPAHSPGRAAELVCSNSFKSEDPSSATGILKAEMRRMDSLVLRCAEEARVPAGLSLAVDRGLFSQRIQAALENHPRIHWRRECMTEPDPNCPTILATGPLTSEPLAEWIASRCGTGNLHFFDAIAPIVTAESIDWDQCYRASRYGKGNADFVNCPLDAEQYERFLDALLKAPMAPLHAFDTPYFEACLPIEVMAQRGRETLRHGPMRPVGLDDPRTGRRPHAVLQLRQDTLAGDHYNLVGFQTRIAWSAQREIFRMIPTLHRAEFVRFGSIHRNTFVKAPEVLDATLAVKTHPNLWIAGQLSGVEGYLESAAAGMAAALSVAQVLSGKQAQPFPRETMLGSLLHYLAHAESGSFAPVNAMLGLMPPIELDKHQLREAKRTGGRRAVKESKGHAYRARALATLEHYLQTIGASG